MRSNVILSVFFFVLCSFSALTFAQEASVPGSQVRSLLVSEIENGTGLQEAATDVSQTVLNESLFFTEPGLAYLAQNQAVYQSLVALLNDNATGFELAIAGFSELPEQPSEVVTISILMFPENANEIYDIALQMQMLNEDDALLAVINAGVDPSTLTATAAGGAGNTFSPLGVGTGAAGAGGGDTTISAN